MEEAEDAIAVVGIGCNFQGVLVEGRNCSGPIPKERFDISSWYDPDENKAGKSRTAKAALINGFNEFDHRLFGISDSEVKRWTLNKNSSFSMSTGHWKMPESQWRRPVGPGLECIFAS
ncbi:hypothetical protein KUDE01_031682 [Dissostichus eleginoides]|uniref:Beta-ketoacyl synthase-like N-terminal domain-containing protein n=1 Tax=Dissostichus eleginoides TaxID=100907 RepID=A0AAD9BNZ2_DISEL|nr:hypothetical protein KUDE01_031682 [Dissostichus eleginoides]